jgi:uncharacterized protein YfaS (alpha-2-macroglobulin family)
MIPAQLLFVKRLTVFMLLLTLLFGCKKKAEPVFTIDPEFTSYVSAFTSGQVSKESNIMIRLMADYPEEIIANESVKDKLFKFQPALKGMAYWTDQRTIEFVPENSLKSGTVYNVLFHLGKVSEVPDHLKTFEFQFQTIAQTFSVHLEPLKSYSSGNMNWHKLTGTILTADVIHDEEIEKVLSAQQESQPLNISWIHGTSGTSHQFTIDSILRKEEPGSATVSWNGKPINVDLSGSETITIPALGDFSLMSISVVQHPEQYIRLVFSDPLQSNQYLDGLIRLENGSDLQFIIEENEIKAYPSVRQIGNLKLFVEAGIKNILGYKLEEDKTFDVNFEEVKPAVRLLGNGVILPHSDGLILPFEAVNLKAVEVRIIQIFETNIGQFLQVNYLDGNNQLKRVGRLIKKKTIDLTSGAPLDYGSWNAYSVDLSELVQTQPGAIYRIEFSFKRKHSLYPCEEDAEMPAETEEIEDDYDEDFEDELSYWDSYESYYYDYDNDYYYYYDWEERDNPCSDYYYGSHRTVARNILASDLGIIAKGGSDHTMTFVVCDLRTTEPLSGVAIEIYNYQQQWLGTTSTDAEGMATVDLEGKPFYLIAKNGDQRGYLRLDDGSSLSLSKFDVSGSVVQKGIKGYIYGERGVWRPGDTLYLTFMLEDRKNSLPANHPVSFELINPMGQVIKKIVKTAGQNGFYSFTTSTPPDAPTGNWTSRIKVGGTTFTKWHRIETVKPNRIKINLDFGTDKLSASRPDVRGSIRATWLHGAIARNLRAQITVRLNQVNTQFPRYADFVFDDPARTFYSEEQTIFDSRLNNEGKADFLTDLSVGSSAPGMLRAHFITRVFEESGEFSIDRYSIPYAPYISFVGIKTPKGDKVRGMLLTDTTHTVDIVTIDPDGNKISRSNLDCKVYKINWRWWWDASYDNLASYIGSFQHSALVSKKVNTFNGEGKFTFRVDYPEWGRYLVRVVDPESGHATGKIVYIDWPGWAGRAQREHPGGASMLTFNADKQKYVVGETATLSIPTSGQGRALISIENGSRVVEAHWVEATEPETRFNLSISDEMSPNIFVNVTLVQPHAQSVNDLPIRLYGVIPIAVENPETRLEPELKMPDALEPGEKVTIRVSEKNGMECSYTIAMVDEGLLDLTRYQTPDPWAVFYAREALGVKTWDLYDMVLGAYGGKMEKIFSIGGGCEEEEDAEGAQSKANRFPPMVKFIGPFTLKKGQTNAHTIKMPRYIGSVKTMVVAGNQVAYGSADKVTPVRKPLMVLATLPRVLGPGEEVKLPVTIFAMEENINEVEVSVEANELIEIVGNTERILNFRDIGDKITEFDLKVKPVLGIAKVSIKAKSRSQSAQYDIELDIRNPNPPVTEFIDTIIEPEETWKVSFHLPGMEGTNKAILEISSMPPVDFGRRLKYLIGYPHGCIEQTTSAAFPQLFLCDVMELDNKTIDKTEENIKTAIRKINTFMLPGGGLSYWPGGQYESDWGTSYAGHFMLEAEAKGYNLPVDFKKKWLRYQKKTARQWQKSSEKYRQSDLTQAYRLYTLALANSPDLGSMNRLREQSDLSVQAAWRLAAAYVLAGQKEIASKMIGNISTEVSKYSGFNYTYGSKERDWAMILETLTLLDQRAKGIDLVKKISGQLSSHRWMSTQTTAYCLLAITRFAGSDATSQEMKYEYSLKEGGRSINAATKLAVAQHDINVTNQLNGYVMVNNKGAGILFARVTMQGIPEIGDQTSASNNLTLQIEYTDMDGHSIDPENILQGIDFLAHVTVSNPTGTENYRDMALTQIFPSGWEIHNTRMDDIAPVNQSSSPNYQDIRDDRVYTYFHLPRYEKKTFVIQLNAAYAGKYYLPTVYCDAMYDERVNARRPGKWIEVSKD